jgi:hypothetical protein
MQTDRPAVGRTFGEPGVGLAAMVCLVTIFTPGPSMPVIVARNLPSCQTSTTVWLGAIECGLERSSVFISGVLG